MTPKDISLVGVRLLGLYLVAQGVLELPNLVALAQVPEDSEFTALMYFLHVSAISAPLILGVVVVVFSSHISNLIQFEPSSPKSGSQVDFEKVQSLVFAAMGLLIIFLTLPKLVATWVAIYQSNAVNERSTGYLTTPAFVFPLVGVVFGLTLFVGARFWTRMYTWFREFGLERK